MRRQIGYSQQVADREHFCDRCCRYIMPGEMYERKVFLDSTPRMIIDREECTILLDSRGRILIDKMHVSPGCDYPWEDEDSDEYRMMKEAEEQAENAEKEASSEVAA